MDSSRRVRLMEAKTETTSSLGLFSQQQLRSDTLHRSCGASTSGRSCDLESRLVHSPNIMDESFYGGALTFQQARGLWRREYYGGLFTALPFYIAYCAYFSSMQPSRTSQNVTLTSLRICTSMSR